MPFLQHWASVAVTFLPVVIPLLGIYGIALAMNKFWRVENKTSTIGDPPEWLTKDFMV